MTNAGGEVLVLDDDSAVRAAMRRLLRSAGHEVRTFSEPDEVLAGPRPERACCLLLDLHMPQTGGLEVQESLARAGVDMPIVFLTGHGDIPQSVRAMKAGAVDFLTKPVSADALLDAIRRALQQDKERMATRRRADELRRRYSALTPREREVFAAVTSGKPNKNVAADLGVAEKTIKVHRARVMEKMQVESFADLVRAAESLGLHGPRAVSLLQ